MIVILLVYKAAKVAQTKSYAKGQGNIHFVGPRSEIIFAKTNISEQKYPSRVWKKV